MSNQEPCEKCGHQPRFYIERLPNGQGYKLFDYEDLKDVSVKIRVHNHTRRDGSPFYSYSVVYADTGKKCPPGITHAVFEFVRPGYF